MLATNLPLRFLTGCALVAAALLTSPHASVRAQLGDPSTLPLLTQDGLVYMGAFRLPGYGIDGVDFTYGGKPVAFNPANNSLFVGKGNYVAEISIPVPVNGRDASELPQATYIQQRFADPTEGHFRDVSSSDVVTYGLLVDGNKLYGAASIYYDATNSQRVSHFARSVNLAQPSFSGWSQVWETARSGFVSGWMASVPAEWQALLGGPAITGQCCIPIISRTSYGPAAFAFDPARVGQPTVAAIPLLFYPDDHTTLGPWEGSSLDYGAATRIGGTVILASTRTVLFVGSNGLGDYCYGEGTGDRSRADGTNVCYDPEDGNKGPHAYPYRYQLWAYDLNDLVAVRDRRREPWEIRPYGVWPLVLPIAAAPMQIGGVGYDMQRQILYVSQLEANRGEFTTSPIINAFKVVPGPRTGR